MTIEAVTKNDYNLSPSRYISQNDTEEILPLEDAVLFLREAEENLKKAEDNLNVALKSLGLNLF